MSDCSARSLNLARGGFDRNICQENRWIILGGSSAVSVALLTLAACSTIPAAPAIAAAAVIMGGALIATESSLFTVFVQTQKPKTFEEKVEEILTTYPGGREHLQAVLSNIHGKLLHEKVNYLADIIELYRLDNQAKLSDDEIYAICALRVALRQEKV
ncbi:hypothetical protein K0U07_01010 [bacterium]|nr:hypothetical protein [bacterium]